MNIIVIRLNVVNDTLEATPSMLFLIRARKVSFSESDKALSRKSVKLNVVIFQMNIAQQMLHTVYISTLHHFFLTSEFNSGH